MTQGRFVAYDSAARLAAFEAKYIPEPNSGCWLWLGATRTARGYPLFYDGARKVGGHRWSYESFVGPIPAGLTIDHLCRTPSCVNPDHLEPVTGYVNTLRGRGFPAANVAKEACPQGHPYSGGNLRLDARGGRVCRRCANDRAIAYAKAHRAQLTERERQRRQKLTAAARGKER